MDGGTLTLTAVPAVFFPSITHSGISSPGIEAENSTKVFANQLLGFVFSDAIWNAELPLFLLDKPLLKSISKHADYFFTVVGQTPI